jgi:hypothetical protein
VVDTHHRGTGGPRGQGILYPRQRYMHDGGMLYKPWFIYLSGSVFACICSSTYYSACMSMYDLSTHKSMLHVSISVLCGLYVMHWRLCLHPIRVSAASGPPHHIQASASL